MFLFRKHSKKDKGAAVKEDPVDGVQQESDNDPDDDVPLESQNSQPLSQTVSGPVAELSDEDRYELLGKLSAGSFGLVHAAKDLITGEEVAIKLIPRGTTVTDSVENEILILRRLNHFHIVKLRRVIVTQKFLGIAMEYAPRGDMYELVKRTQHGFDENTARWFFQQLVIAVDYSHRMGISHRDIKLRNAVLKEIDGRFLVKLCDFGFGKDHTRQSMAKTRLGTLEYMAPELLVRSTSGSGYDGAKVDVWSLGVALFFMLTKAYPFEIVVKGQEAREVAIMRAILTGPVLLPGFVSEQCQHLLAHMLTKNPAERYSVRDIQQHPWYCEGLPRGALEMNNNPLIYQPQPGLQSEAEIKALCTKARTMPGRQLAKIYSGLDDANLQAHLDTEIDDVMEGLAESLDSGQNPIKL